MAARGSGRDKVTVIMPPEPPDLSPGAARALLKILLKAYEKEHGHPYTPGAEPEPREDGQEPGAVPDDPPGPGGADGRSSGGRRSSPVGHQGCPGVMCRRG
jgi:hypothetical protein